MARKDYTTFDDEALMRLTARGEDGAFAELYARHKGWVYRVALRMTRRHADALDVVQEVFAYVVKKAPGFRLTAKFTTFLYPVVRSSAAGIYRKRREVGGGDEIAVGMAGDEVAVGDGDGGSRAAIERALAGLGETHREVVELRFMHGMDLASIAVAVGVPVGTVKSRLHHAIKGLREMDGLREWFEADQGEPGDGVAR